MVLLPRLYLKELKLINVNQNNNNISHIQLQNSDKFFIINTEFEPLINRYQWFQTNSNGHIFTYIGSNLTYLHQLIYGNYNTSIYVIDHINRNVLDNTLSNLRLATVSQNGINKSNFTNNPTGFMGIKPTNFNTYQVSIGVNNKNLNIGRVFFEFPQDFDFVKNKHRDVYKIGFLYECLELVYPDISKTSKYDIINLKYHFFITYRRFKDLLDEYYASKKKYLENRNLL